VVTILKANSHLLSLKLPVEHLSSTDATALVSGTAVEKLDLGVRETTLSALSAIFHSRTIKELRLNISSLSKDCDSGKEKQDLSHSVSENTTLRKLVLHGSSDYKEVPLEELAILSPRWEEDGEDLKEVERTAAKIRGQQCYMV
jgi:hypothetical protein